jgi:hypothetical protein
MACDERDQRHVCTRVRMTNQALDRGRWSEAVQVNELTAAELDTVDTNSGELNGVVTLGTIEGDVLHVTRHERSVITTKRKHARCVVSACVERALWTLRVRIVCYCFAAQSNCVLEPTTTRRIIRLTCVNLTPQS